MSTKPVALLILDGFGISSEKEGNAVYAAKTPNLEKISRDYQGTTLHASGIEVGLAWGEMGSSEVGHTNLGAGLVVYQNLPRINLAIQDRSFFALPIWETAAAHARKNRSDLHLMGLVSNGGVHSHIDHLFSLLDVFRNLKFEGNIFIHMFTDGQDTAPKSGVKFLEMLEGKIAAMPNVRIATVIGRYYAMDKNENWDRTKSAYDCLTLGKGIRAATAREAFEAAYEKGLIDETLEPTVIVGEGGNPRTEGAEQSSHDGAPVGLIKENDAVIFTNFRADRARQLTQAFVFPEFRSFERTKIPGLEFISMTSYGIEYPIASAFPAQYITAPLAKVISEAGRKQFHIAETEKYAHVTYFFNGGTEKEFPGEDRAIIPSKQVKSYDLKPEMSASEIVARVVGELGKSKYDFLVINLANGDLVGHTGKFDAGVKAVEVLDECVGTLAKAILEMEGTLVITGDHGNVEEMINGETGEIDKEHSVNPVPFWIVGNEYKRAPSPAAEFPSEPGGILADVAPTILEIMGIAKPEGMTGSSLLNVISDCPLPK